MQRVGVAQMLVESRATWERARIPTRERKKTGGMKVDGTTDCLGRLQPATGFGKLPKEA